MKNNERIEALAKVLEGELLTLYKSPLLHGDALLQCLGYKSPVAFRQAQTRSTVPVKVFSIQNRRGKFALTRDVALWLATQRVQNVEKEEDENMA